MGYFAQFSRQESQAHIKLKSVLKEGQELKDGNFEFI
jgi:hypothetical protein